MISGFISFKDYNTSYWQFTHGVQSVSRWYTRSKASVTVGREWRRPWRQKWNGTYALAKPRSTRLAACTQAESSYIWQIFVTCGYFPHHRNLHLCRYWQLIRFPQIVGIWDTKESPVFTYHVEPCCVFTTPLYLMNVQVLVCGQSVWLGALIGELRERVHEDQADMFEVYPTTNLCKINHLWKSMAIIHLAPCTVHTCWRICLSKPIVGTWFNDRHFRYVS